MYSRRRMKRAQTELVFVEFESPFSKHLRADNRWVRLSELIPWEDFELEYASNFSGRGNEAFPFRVALGTLIAKEYLGLTDREIVEEITENPYIQYFLGFTDFLEAAPFDATLLVHFRKRIPMDLLTRMNEQIALGQFTKGESVQAAEVQKNDKDQDPPNTGKMIIDATCAPEDMKYPTDLGLLNDAREITEQVIDNLWETISSEQKSNRRKPRTYRRKARQTFLSVIRQKKAKHSAIRKGIRKQLGYLSRNVKTIETLVNDGASLSCLPPTLYRKLLVSSEVLRQQRELYTRTCKEDRHVDDRIVSISKPHVRPIVRGKARAPVEFGAKISASVIKGMFFLDRHSWDAFNECGDLIGQAETFRKRTGFYPESIHADKIYRSRANIAWCKERGIRLSGPLPGRPVTDESEKRKQKKLQGQDELDRIEIEGKFGVSKRRFSMGRIMTKLRSTSEHSAALVFMLINLGKILRDLLLSIFKWIVLVILGRFYDDRLIVIPA